MCIKIKDKKKILVVDDDNAQASTLTMLLETRGYHVSNVSSVEEMLEKVDNGFDLVLIDVNHPDRNGFDSCCKIREHSKINKIPVVILSAKLLKADIVEGLYLGADDYLTKPFEFEELVARIEALIRRSQVFNGNGKDNSGEEVIILELREIIENRQIQTFFQPIYKLKTFKVLGVEALTRPDTKSMLSNPELTFKMAIQFGCYQELEMLAWETAIHTASKFITKEKLFLNCNPYFVEGPNFLKMCSVFQEANINVSNVVLEITERSEVVDFKRFYRHLAQYKKLGFDFAVDDVGGGYASLQSIVETKPKVVKIDGKIIKGICGDQYKRSIVKFIVSFCRENNILSVAEGIETKEDLEAVISLDVEAAQGYYLSRPASEKNLKKMLIEECSL